MPAAQSPDSAMTNASPNTVTLIPDEDSFERAMHLIERANSNLRAYRELHGSLPEIFERFLQFSDFGSHLLRIESAADAAGTSNTFISFKPTELLFNLASATGAIDFDNLVIEY